jgi:hypothetical protein
LFPRHRHLGLRGGDGSGILQVLERVLGSSTHPAALGQEHAQPAGRNVDPRLLLQIGRQPLGRPDVEREPQRAGRRLQRRQVGGIRLHGAARARRIGQGGDSTRGEARQPVRHGFDRAPAPAGDAPHVVAQPRRFDHLQPLAHPPRQVRAPQLPLDVLTLLGREAKASRLHPHTSSRWLPRALPRPRRCEAYLLFAEFISEYLAHSTPYV